MNTPHLICLAVADVATWLPAHDWRCLGTTDGLGVRWRHATGRDLVLPHLDAQDETAAETVADAIEVIAEVDATTPEAVADRIGACHAAYHGCVIATRRRRSVDTASWTVAADPVTVRGLVERVAASLPMPRLRNWLHAHGWRHQSTDDTGLEVWTAAGESWPMHRNAVWLPRRRSSRDDDYYVIQTIYRSAAWADRPVREVARELAGFRPDAVLQPLSGLSTGAAAPAAAGVTDHDAAGLRPLAA